MSDTLIVGGSGGIGGALVSQFAAAGHDVCLTYLRAAETAHGVADVVFRSHGTPVAVERLDLRDPDQARSVVRACGPDPPPVRMRPRTPRPR